MQMSQSAERALINVGTNRQGATVQADPDTLAELSARGLVGRSGGLTRSGTIKRQVLVNRVLDEAF